MLDVDIPMEASQSTGFKADDILQLTDMGFTENQAKKALKETARFT